MGDDQSIKEKGKKKPNGKPAHLRKVGGGEKVGAGKSRKAMTRMTIVGERKQRGRPDSRVKKNE